MNTQNETQRREGAEKNELRELDAWIAEHLFHWEWLCSPHNECGERVVRRAIFPPADQCGEDGAWIRFNFAPHLWDKADNSIPLYSDWDQTCARDDDRIKGQKRQFGLPHYSTDPGAALMVLEKCANKLCEEDCEETVSIGIEVPYFVVEKTNTHQSIRVEANFLPLAICLFAKQLFGK